MAEDTSKKPVELGPFAARVIDWMDANKVSGRSMAKRCHLSPSYFTTLRTGKTGVPSMRTIEALSKEMGEDLFPYAMMSNPGDEVSIAREVERGRAERDAERGTLVESNVRHAPDEVARQFERGPLARDVPMMGVSVGGEDHDFSFNGIVEQHVERPRGLAHARKAFALFTVGESMVPAYEENTTIFINPAKPPAIMDYVVVEFLPDMEDADNAGQPAGKALLKRLVGRTSSHYVLKQYNPALEFKVERGKVKNLWRVVPPNELLGFS